MNWQGQWDSATSYAVNDVVEYNGSSWIAVSANSNSAPSDSSSDWDLVARQGMHGGGFTLRYNFDSSMVDGDPGNGKLRFDAHGSGVSEIYIDHASAEQQDVTAALTDLDDSTSAAKGMLRISHATDATKFVLLQIDGVLVPGSPSYDKIPVSYRDGSFTFPFSDGDPLVFSFTRTGDTGDNPNTIEPGGRLTYASGDPLPEGSLLNRTTVYYTPYKSNVVPIYNGTRWVLFTFSELSKTIPNTSDQMYDVFLNHNRSTLQLEFVAWTNDTTRATALTRQDGILVKSDNKTWRYIGTFRTGSTSGKSEDSVSKRLLYNAYQKENRRMARFESLNTWTIPTNWRAFRNDSSMACELVLGEDAAFVDLAVMAHHQVPAGEESFIGIGFNATTAPTSLSASRISNGGANSMNAHLHGRWVFTSGAARYHKLYAVEKSTGGTANCKNDLNYGLDGYAYI